MKAILRFDCSSTGQEEKHKKEQRAHMGDFAVQLCWEMGTRKILVMCNAEITLCLYFACFSLNDYTCPEGCVPTFSLFHCDAN